MVSMECYYNAMWRFKSLPHLTADKEPVEDGYYAPNLYFYDGAWHVTWIECEEGDALIDFESSEIFWAIEEAYDWCVENGLKNDRSWKR